jgi:membrane-bound metal-dependent hydrolase YbcI (DUF457 family)
MPLPLGHAAIGWAAFESVRKTDSCGQRVGLFVYVTVLANLPDLDILASLLVDGNGYAFHRGPTHSLLFALLAGFIASRAWRMWRRIPQLSFGLCALLIFSHVAADMLLTSSPVSLFWPFELHLSAGYSNLEGVVRLAVFQSVKDVIIAAAALIYIAALRLSRKELCLFGKPFPLAKSK